jgi:hypothetical protein
VVTRGLAVSLLVLLGTIGTAQAAPRLDPFRSAADPRPAPFNPLRPVRAPVGTLGQVAPALPPAPATPATPAPPAAREGDVCTADDQCPAGTICEQGRCRAVEPPIHAFLYRKEGGSTAFYPFYFSRLGNPGHRVFAPFYWHFWSPEDRSKVIAPFYWRFENHLSRRVVTVIPPWSHTIQPDAESWAIWPIFYRSTKFGWAAPLLLSFKISDPAEGRSFGLYGLLYFWKRNEKQQSAFDLLFPLMVSKRSPSRAFTWVFPLNFYWRGGDTSRFLGIPLYYRQRGPEGDKDLLLPIFYWSRHKDGGTLGSIFGYYSRDGGNRNGAAAWLYWFGRRTDGRKYDVLFPLLWSFRSPSSNTTILPPLVHLRRNSWSFTTAFPFYWAGKDYQQGSSWKLFLPVYFSRVGAEGRTFTWLTPLGGYRRDSDRQSRTVTFLLPPFIYRRDPQRELDMAALVYWRYKNKLDGATTTLAGPFYRRSDPQGSTTTLFPLFWHFRDGDSGATAHSLFPLYFRRNAPDHTLTAAGVFPLWGYYRNYQEGGYSAGLFPLAFFSSRPDRGHGVLFPLLWHFRNRDRSSTLALPFFLRFADQNSTTAAVPPLLYFYGRQVRQGGSPGQTYTERYHVQFPLFWRFSNDQTGNATTVIPPIYWKSGPSGWSGGLFPLVWASSWKDKGHFVLFPLFWRFRDDKADRTTTVVANYLHRRHGDETTDALFPLLHWRRGTRPGGKPETSFTLFPLVHYRKDSERRVLVTPLAFTTRSSQTRAGIIPPYFWYEGRQVSASGIPPLWFDFTRKETGERTRLFGPWVMVDTPRSRARILFPLFGRYSDDKESGTWVFPAYFRRRTREGYALDTLFPLVWRSTWPGHSTTVVGNFYRRVGTDRYSSGFVPLYFYANDNNRRLWLTPLFYQRRDHKEDTSRLIALPLFFRSTRPDGHTTVQFPFYWSGRTGPSSHRVLFPLAWHFRNDEERTATNFWGPIYWASSAGGAQRTRGILPVVWYSRDDERRTASHALMPLFYEKHGPSQQTVVTLPFGFHRQPDRHWWYVLNVFRKDSVQSSFTMVFPLWFSHLNKTTETSTRVIPILHFSRQRPDRGLTSWFLLFWRHRSIDSATTLGLPILYDVHNYHQNRLTFVVPIFFRYWRASDDTAYNLAPLFYRRSSPTSSSTVAFPLVWDFNSAERRTTVVFPLFVGVRRPTYQARFIFPSIYYRKGLGPQAGTSRLFIFPLWESAVKRPGDFMWEAVLGLFGYERIGRNRYLKLLFIPFELEPAPAAQTAWYGKPPPRHKRERERERRYGLDTRAW